MMFPVLLLAAGALLMLGAARSAEASETRERTETGRPVNSPAVAAAAILDTSESPHALIAPVPVSAVAMGDGFWKPWMDANRTKGLPALLDQLERHGAIDNFRRLSGAKKMDRQGRYFSDSDVFKWMEGAAWALASGPDEALKTKLNSVIGAVEAAQRPDGYLNTFFVDELADERFRNLGVEHELYCAGHLFQAAVAHHRATGETRLLRVAERYADFLVEHFGPGRIEQADGHPEVEMALVELYRTTGKRRYLDLAGFLLSVQKFQERKAIGGHAVREGYIAAGAADYYAETADAKWRTAVEAVWNDMASGKVYITGGLGSRHGGEAVGNPFELPNERAYAETCAAISSVMWNLRMLGISADGKYADMMERALYNGFLSGVSLDTASWFYVNPLACWEDYQRSPWFGCTCCPTNAVRMLASIPGYIYGVSEDGVWAHLYEDCRMDWRLKDGCNVSIEQKTRYPWDGRIKMTVSPEKDTEFTLHLRIPGWCSSASIEVCGEAVPANPQNGYVAIRRTWKAGDSLELNLEMPVRMMEADPRVTEDRGSVALQRGPLVYCLESPDNPSVPLRTVSISADERFKRRTLSDGPLRGITVLDGEGKADAEPLGGPLYRPLGGFDSKESTRYPLTAIPYYAWANRGPSRMTVWIPLTPR